MRHDGTPAEEVRLRNRRHDDLHVVLWCRHGTARVECAKMPTGPPSSPSVHHLTAGEALLVPATVPHTVTLAARAIAHPVLLPAGPAGPDPTPTQLIVDRPLALALLTLCVAEVSELRPATSDLAQLADRVLRAFARSTPPTPAQVTAFIPWVSNPPGTQLLLYAALGTSTVVLRPAAGAETVVEVPERMALAVPHGLAHRVLTDPEGVAMPIFHDPHDPSGLPDTVDFFHLPPPLRELAERHFMANTSALRPEQWDDAALPGSLADCRQHTVVARLDGTPPSLVDRIRERVLRDPGDPITVAGWAEQAGVSRRTLERDFRRRVGDSVLGWRNAVRAERAAELLAAGHQAKWVARRLGFTHPSAFTRSFRDTHGISPRDYRASLRAG